MKMKCSKCSKEVGVRTDVYNARIKKFGTEAELIKNYLCITCRAEAKEAEKKVKAEEKAKAVEAKAAAAKAADAKKK